PIAPREVVASPSAWGMGVAALPPERVIRGVVVDEAGRPVAGATVRPVRSEKAREPAKTASDGRFTLVIGGFMLVEEDLVASADDRSLMGLGKHIEPRDSGPAAPARIVLKSSRTVVVHVQDAAG